MILRVDYDELDISPDYTQYMYEGKPFTGIAFELWPNGRLRDEVNFVGGMKDGISRSWSESGVLLDEGKHFENWGHGIFREWYENGQLKREMEIELGILLHQRDWSETGELMEEYCLPEDSSDWRFLKFQREQFGPELKARAQSSESITAP